MAGSLDEMFAPIAPAVHDFAARHGMEINKYRYGMPIWIITFSEEEKVAASKRLLRSGNINVTKGLDGSFYIEVVPAGFLLGSNREMYQLDPLSDVSQQLEAAFLKLQGK